MLFKKTSIFLAYAVDDPTFYDQTSNAKTTAEQSDNYAYLKSNQGAPMYNNNYGSNEEGYKTNFETNPSSLGNYQPNPGSYQAKPNMGGYATASYFPNGRLETPYPQRAELNAYTTAQNQRNLGIIESNSRPNTVGSSSEKKGGLRTANMESGSNSRQEQHFVDGAGKDGKDAGGAAGNEDGKDAGAAGNEDGKDAGAAGNEDGKDSGAAGNEDGKDTGAAGNEDGKDAGAAGNEDGKDAGGAAGNKGDKSAGKYKRNNKFQLHGIEHEHLETLNSQVLAIMCLLKIEQYKFLSLHRKFVSLQ